MWWKDRVYFASDRDGTMNIWSMKPDGSDVRQHTHHDGWDVRSPALSQGRIVYQLGADLRLYEIDTNRETALTISLSSDFDQLREKWLSKPMDYLTSAHLSPKGDRIALTARGRVYVAPVEQGRFTEVTANSRFRYRQARFLPDGQSLVALSDETGEVEWWKLPANGAGASEQISSDSNVLRFDGVPSPDGTWIASYDKDRQLWLHGLGDKKGRRIASCADGDIQDLAWSPDSAWLAFVMPADSGLGQIWVAKVADGSSFPLTSARADSYSPSWSKDGTWIYFLSDRALTSTIRGVWGTYQPEPFMDRPTNLYAIALEPGQRFPFAPDDELRAPETKSEKESGEKKKETKEPAPAVKVAIEQKGLMERLYRVPVDAGQYRSLSVRDNRLFWLSYDLVPDSKGTLTALDIANKNIKTKSLVRGVESYELSMDGSKLLVQTRDALSVIDSSSGENVELGEKTVKLDAWRIRLDPRDEYRQMFTEAWRLERDYFYDRKMHGVDWKGTLEKYRPLADRVTDRSEVSDLLAQMVSELSALHIFVRGGDLRTGKDDVPVASFGAVLARDEKGGGMRVARIYRADPDYPDELSPLARPGVAVQEGDVIESINGQRALDVPDPGVLLRHQAGRQVLLGVKGAAGGPPRDVIVTPLTPDEAADLRYEDWEYARRRRVEEAGAGQIGYVHLRAMGTENWTEWARNFYPVFQRQGLIIDVRHNRGGNIDSWIIEKLLRRAWAYWQPNVGRPYANMQYAFRGHMVVLTDARTSSDGELFAEGFRRLELGKVIGTRTWGGEIWLTSSNVLVDNGIATAAEFGVYGPEGQWLIEGWGVEPDIVVDNLPHETYNGKDAQLDAAIRHLQELIKKEPLPVPPNPPYPDKSWKEATR